MIGFTSDWIPAAWVQGMAAQQAPHSLRRSLKNAVPLDRLTRIL